MDVDANHHGEEGIAFSGVDVHIMKMVIIEHSIIYSFAGSTVIVGLLIFLCPSRNRCIEPDVPFRFYIDAAAIGGRRARSLTGAGVYLPQASGHRHLRECFCLQYPQLTIRKPAMHKGVPSSSMEVMDAVSRAFTDFMTIRGGVGMDTGAIVGKGDTICRDKSVPEGREECGTPKTCWSRSSK